MNYKETSVLSQLSADPSDELRLPSFASGFIQEGKAQLLTFTADRGTKTMPATETKVLGSIKPPWQKLFKSLCEPVPPRDNPSGVLDGMIRDNALLSSTGIIKEQAQADAVALSVSSEPYAALRTALRTRTASF